MKIRQLKTILAGRKFKKLARNALNQRKMTKNPKMRKKLKMKKNQKTTRSRKKQLPSLKMPNGSEFKKCEKNGLVRRRKGLKRSAKIVQLEIFATKIVHRCKFIVQKD
jgi:hypothetical protein